MSTVTSIGTSIYYAGYTPSHGIAFQTHQAWNLLADADISPVLGAAVHRMAVARCKCGKPSPASGTTGGFPDILSPTVQYAGTYAAKPVAPNRAGRPYHIVGSPRRYAASAEKCDQSSE